MLRVRPKGGSTRDGESAMTRAQGSIAANIQRLRARSGLTQEAVAEACGLSAVYYKSLERGTATNPTVRALVSIAEVFGVPPAALLEDRPRPAPRPPGRPAVGRPGARETAEETTRVRPRG